MQSCLFLSLKQFEENKDDLVLFLSPFLFKIGLESKSNSKDSSQRCSGEIEGFELRSDGRG